MEQIEASERPGMSSQQRWAARLLSLAVVLSISEQVLLDPLTGKLSEFSKYDIWWIGVTLGILLPCGLAWFMFYRYIDYLFADWKISYLWITVGLWGLGIALYPLGIFALERPNIIRWSEEAGDNVAAAGLLLIYCGELFLCGKIWSKFMNSIKPGR